MGQFSFQYPAWTIGICFLVAIASGLALYYKTKQLSDKGYGHKLVLSILRFFSVFSILILLLNPLYKYFKQTIQKPILVFAQDVSSSIDNKDTNYLITYIRERDKAEQKLSDKYEIVHLEFASQTLKNKSDIYNGTSSNINSIFDYMANQMDLQYIKSIVLASDGIYNAGKNPNYQSLLQQLPVYPVLFGDTTQEKDLLITNVFHNEIIYSGDQFAIQCDLQSWNLNGENTNLSIKKFSDGQWLTLQKEDLTIDQKKYFLTKEFIIQTHDPGIYKYKLDLTPVQGETNLKNNSREFYIEVLDSKKKILILVNNPHPDIATLKEALSSNKNYEIEVHTIQEQVNKFEKYSLVVFHQLPGSGGLGVAEIKQAQFLKIPQFFIIGTQTNISAFNAIQSIVEITGYNNSINESTPLIRPGFAEFTLSDPCKEAISKFPPLNSFFGNYKLDPTASILFFQKIGKIETNYPLWLFADKSGQRTSYLLGDGLWKWKFNEFANKNNFDGFYELISKTVQLTSTLADSRKLRINQNRKIYNEGESIEFNGEFYNDNFERINAPDLKIEIKGPNSLKYDFSFSKIENYYHLNAGALPQGDYTFEAKLEWNQKENKVNGKFSIQALDLESNNRVADFDLLRNMANKSGGQCFKPNQMNELADALLSDQQTKSILTQNLEIKPLIDQKLLFFLIFLALALEWFLRRFWGSY